MKLLGLVAKSCREKWCLSPQNSRCFRDKFVTFVTGCDVQLNILLSSTAPLVGALKQATLVFVCSSFVQACNKACFNCSCTCSVTFQIINGSVVCSTWFGCFYKSPSGINFFLCPVSFVNNFCLFHSWIPLQTKITYTYHHTILVYVCINMFIYIYIYMYIYIGR
jgi:hypothetical protein